MSVKVFLVSSASAAKDWANGSSFSANSSMLWLLSVLKASVCWVNSSILCVFACVADCFKISLFVIINSPLFQSRRGIASAYIAPFHGDVFQPVGQPGKLFAFQLQNRNDFDANILKEFN